MCRLLPQERSTGAISSRPPGMAGRGGNVAPLGTAPRAASRPAERAGGRRVARLLQQLGGVTVLFIITCDVRPKCTNSHFVVPDAELLLARNGYSTAFTCVVGGLSISLDVLGVLHVGLRRVESLARRRDLVRRAAEAGRRHRAMKILPPRQTR